MLAAATVEGTRAAGAAAITMPVVMTTAGVVEIPQLGG